MILHKMPRLFGSLLKNVGSVRAATGRNCSGEIQKAKEVAQADSAYEKITNIPTYTPDNLDKRILVHFKYFPSISEVPVRVPQGMMNTVRQKQESL